MKPNRSTGWIGMIYLVIAFFLIIILVKGISKKRGIFNNGIQLSIGNFSENLPLYKNYTFGRQTLDLITVDGSSESIIITESDTDDINVNFYGNWDKVQPSAELDKDYLMVTGAKKSNINLLGNRRIEILLPKTKTGTLVCNSASGSIKITNMNFESMKINSASGSIKVSNCNADSAEFSTASGSKKIEDCNFGYLKSKSASGSFKFEGEVKSFNINSASGSIAIENETVLTEDSSIKSASGSVKIALPKHSNFVLECESGTGSIHNDITGNSYSHKARETVGTGEITLKIITASGSIRIE